MRKTRWSAFLLALLPCFPLSAGGGEAENDPILRELQQLKGKEDHRNPSAPLLAEYGFDRRKLEVFTGPRSEPKTENASISSVTASRYLPVEEYRSSASISTFPPELYLGLKQIVEPLPEDYARAYLKLKTLLNPTRKYVRVHIDKSRQRMWVYLDNDYVGDWKVSTARRGYWTPVGEFRPYTLHRMHYSRKYHNSPMPWSVFFKGGYAIHGTDAIRRLGRPASHGCIRVHPRNAKKLYQLIKRYGKQNTRIIIRG
jgi:lipoprotein-anchoring transpeptidase ErfK/SrfK